MEDRTTPSVPGDILRVEHLTMRFGGLVAINDLSLSARRGDITAVIGPNGAGKTTVFNCITGFYKPTEGRICACPWRTIGVRCVAQPHCQRKPRVASQALARSSSLSAWKAIRSRREARVARTFQNIRLFSGMTVLENLLVAQHNVLNAASGYTVGGLFGLKSYKKAEAEAIERAAFWLNEIGLIDRADDPAGDLPYGAQRRLEIARAMCTSPVLLCLG